MELLLDDDKILLVEMLILLEVEQQTMQMELTLLLWDEEKI